MAGVRKVPISDLGPGISNAMIIAVLIAKQTPRKVANKRNPGTERAVWSFTLRDTPYDFINASYWGSVENVNSIASKLHVGDVGALLVLAMKLSLDKLRELLQNAKGIPGSQI